jgi:hypothetical protein
LHFGSRGEKIEFFLLVLVLDPLQFEDESEDEDEWQLALREAKTR